MATQEMPLLHVPVILSFGNTCRFQKSMSECHKKKNRVSNSVPAKPHFSQWL